MKKIRYLFLFLIVMCMTSTVFAQIDAPIIVEWKDGVPYDIDGNPMEFFNDAEKMLFYDETRDKNNWIVLDQDYNILEERNEITAKDPTDHYPGEEIEAEDEPIGWITFSATLPKEIDGKDVEIGIICSDENGKVIHSGDYRLIKQNNYELTEAVPVGIYNVSKAIIAGDTAYKYPCVYDKDIEVREDDGTSMSFEFQLSESVEMENPGTKVEMQESAVTMEKKKEGLPLIAYIGIVCGFVVLVFLILFIRMKWREYSQY